jgi:hypothetical protein
MKRTVTALATTAVILSLVACGSTKPVTNADEQIRNQRLSTSFVQEGIKIETDCAWYKPWKSDADCEIVSIESVGTAATNGATTNNRKTALVHASNNAKANVSHFIREDITSTRVTSTIAKNIEKASDRLGAKNNGAVVEMSDEEAKKTLSVRENANDTAHQLTQNVRVNSVAVLKGFKVIKQDVVGDQEVMVTIRWDKQSEATANRLARKFSQQ